MQRNSKDDEPTAASNARPPETPALLVRLRILDERTIAKPHIVSGFLPDAHHGCTNLCVDFLKKRGG